MKFPSWKLAHLKSDLQRRWLLEPTLGGVLNVLDDARHLKSKRRWRLLAQLDSQRIANISWSFLVIPGDSGGLGRFAREAEDPL